jgi:hypothetical protein
MRAMRQNFTYIHINNTYDLFRLEILQSILNKFGVPMKIVGKNVSLKETRNKLPVGPMNLLFRMV